MNRVASQTERDFHGKMATECFNEAWNHLDNAARDANDDQRMLHLTHTSRYHWSLVGNARNLVIGDWKISRVYADLKQPELALRFATTSLDLCKGESLSDLYASAYEGMARAYTIAEDRGNARKYIELARAALNSINDEEERLILADQIDETEAMIDWSGED